VTADSATTDVRRASDVVVIGAGFAGLATALFLARRGHAVALVERDGAPQGDSADDDADGWRRPGVPQAHQSHLLLARARRVMLDEAPDVLDALLARGVHELPVRVGAGELPGEAFLLTRRLVAEGVLRRIVDAEHGIDVVIGAVVGLETADADLNGVPRVTGVRLASGTVVSAQLVVDCGGRRSTVMDWLSAVGARPPMERSQDCGFFYATRYYRARPGETVPVTRVPTSLALDYATVLAAGGDNDTFSVTVTLSVDDPLRARIRVPELYTAFASRVPLSAAWLAIGDPITPVSTMARIENRHRSFVDADGPVVTGLVAVGDAALHTNPTMGRGISLALAHAQHLASVAGLAASDPLDFAQRFHDWTEQHLVGWFDAQVAADAVALQRLQAGVRGERVAPPDDPRSSFAAGAFACAEHDPVVASAVASVVHLFEFPSVALAGADVGDRVRRHLAATPPASRPPDVVSRTEFEALMA
jgi:flavin-dependent dehydrogenase